MGEHYVERGNWLFEFIEEWSQFFESCNWYTFHPIHFEIENESHMGGAEFSLIILGLGLRIRWNYNEEAEGMVKVRAAMKDWEERHPSKED